MQSQKSVFLRRVVDQLFKSNLTFRVVCVFNLLFSVFKTNGSFTIDSSTPTSTPNLKKHHLSLNEVQNIICQMVDAPGLF
jgi:hypothetical protein